MIKITDQQKILALDSMRVASSLFWGLHGKFGDGLSIHISNDESLFTFHTGKFMEFIGCLPWISRAEWLGIESTPEIESAFVSLLDEAIIKFGKGAENGPA